MGPALDDVALVQDQHQASFADGAQPVGEFTDQTSITFIVHYAAEREGVVLGESLADSLPAAQTKASCFLIWRSVDLHPSAAHERFGHVASLRTSEFSRDPALRSLQPVEPAEIGGGRGVRPRLDRVRQGQGAERLPVGARSNL